MKFKHAAWRKLYREEQGAFARLPWFARAAAGELLKACDDAGRIDVGGIGEGETPGAALTRTIAYRMGATRGDRRLMLMLFPMLFDEGYLVVRGSLVVIRNYVAAQRRWTDEEPELTEPPADGDDHEAATTEQRPSNDPTTNEPRPSNEAATTEQRSDHGSATKGDASTRNHSSEIASARARARSSVPSSSDPIRDEQNPLTPVAGADRAGAPERIFAHWRTAMNSPRSVLDPKRRRLIQDRLAHFSEPDLCRAIDGCRADAFSMGENDRNKPFNTVSVIFRDAEHVERFLALAPGPDSEAIPEPPREIAPLEDQRRAKRQALAILSKGIADRELELGGGHG